MRTSILVLLLLAFLSITIIQPVFAGYEPDTVNPGVFLPAQSLSAPSGQSDQHVFELLPLLDRQSLTQVHAPAGMSILTLKPGEVWNPGIIRNSAQTLFIIEGIADVMVDEAVIRVNPDDAILIPAGSRLIITNTGNSQLSGYYAISSLNVEKNRPAGTMISRKASDIAPVNFGEEKNNTRFSITRLLNPGEAPLPLSFDLAIASVPEGSQVPAHALECGQTGYVLSGTGNISIACTSYDISPGDIVYVPEHVVQEITATTALRLLLLTEPYYSPELDHPADGLC